MKRTFLMVLTALMVFVLFTGCSQEKKGNVENTTKKEPIFTTANYPKVDGSTATIPLSEQFAADTIIMKKQEAATYIKHNTTHNAYVNLIEKKADIIFVTSPSEEELQLAKKAGVEFEIYPVVNEGFVFMVNKNNRVSSLTQQQIKDIYAGKIKNWKEVGGEDREIIAYQREVNSGSQTGMISLVMKDTALADAPKEKRIEGMAGLIEAVAGYDNSAGALGYSYYYYVNSMYVKEGIKLLKIDGVEPNPTTIQSKAYPYTTAYYVIVRKDEPQNSQARKLLNWCLSDEGQKSAKEAGYVPVK